MDVSSNLVSPPSRRQLIRAAVAGVAVSISGCAGGEDETTGDTPPSGATTPTSDFNMMSNGSLVVEVNVDSQFDGGTVLEADCRDEDVAIGSGESTRIERRTAGETCAIRLDITSESTFEAAVFAHESYHLTVTRDGDVERETVEL